MDSLTPQPPRRLSFWSQWGLVTVVCSLLAIGLLFLQAQRLGSASAPLPADHVALRWDGWVFLADPVPGTKPSAVLPPQATSFGDVSLRPGDLDLLVRLQQLVPEGVTFATVPDPFSPDRPPAVPSIWEPLAQQRKRAGVTTPLVVLRRGLIPLTPFQTALSWSDPGGLVIVIDITELGSDSTLAAERLLKLLRHEYGHLARCTHASGCVMNAVRTMAEVDRLPLEYCPDCASQVRALPFGVPGEQKDPTIRIVDPVTGQER